MKIRTNFVSNSSSSNFCVMGYECPPEWERHDILQAFGFNYERESDLEHNMWYDFIDGMPNRLRVVDKDDNPEHKYVIGVDVAKNEDDGLRDCSYDLQEVLKELSELDDIPNLSKNIKIVSGQYPC